MLQTQLTRSHANGVYYGLFWSANIDGTGLNSDYGDELDYFVGFNNSIGDVEVDAGLTYRDLVHLFGTSRDDAWTPYAELTKTFNKANWKLCPFVRVDYWKVNKNGPLIDGGIRMRLGARINTVAMGFSWNARTSVLYEDGMFGYRPATIFEFQGAVTDRIGSVQVTLPSLLLMNPISASNGQIFHAVIGANVQYQF